MTGRNEFWNFFENEASPKLALREKTFRKIFEYLDTFDGPISIIETGCIRVENNWEGDGQSTILFDKYISSRDHLSECRTVDINQKSVSLCKKLVSDRVKVHQDDSVHYLSLISKEFLEHRRIVNFVYLDSFDLNWTHWYPSAIHHLKELVAIIRCFDEKTLLVVDDCLLNVNFVYPQENKVVMIDKPKIGGKGRLIAEYASAVGANLEFADYQAGWTGF
jgi:hypothetical protein